MKVDERDWTVDRDVSESDEGTRSVGGDADDSARVYEHGLVGKAPRVLHTLR